MSKPAKLPGLPAPNFQDAALQRWAQAVTERLEVREGSRGDPLEQVVLKRDLKRLPATQFGAVVGAPSPDTLNGYAEIPIGNGLTASLDMNAFAEKLRNTQLFRELSSGINTARFDSLATEVKELLNRRLVSETMARGAQIARTELKISEVSRAIAATSTELTAAIASSAAGIRSTQFAIATETSAIAGQVTQLEARLLVDVATEDLLPVPPASPYSSLSALTAAVPASTADTRKYYRVAGSPEQLYRSDGSTWNLVGSQSSAKLEEVLLVTADKALGLESQYTIKVTAGNAIAGFGIAATERDGVPESAFIIQADKFALVAPYTFSQETTPSATAIGQTWYKPSTKQSFRATTTGTGGWVTYTPSVPFSVNTITRTAYFSGDIITGGQVKATGSTTDIAFGNYSILANPSNSSVNGILGQSINGVGVRGYSENNYAGLFTGGGGQPTVYIESGSSVAGLRVQGQPGGAAISVTQGYITRPFSTTGRLTVYEQTSPYNAVGTYLYEFHV